MNTQKRLYVLLKEANLIKEEKYNIYPTRMKEKSYGYMWKGEVELQTVDGLLFTFCLWHHCENDTGGSWYPSEKEIDKMWREKLIPRKKIPHSERVDSDWHQLYVDNHVYISEKGFFDSKFDFDTFTEHNKRKEEIIKSINDGTWVNDSDIWMLI
jgi:hypothetical protein